MILNMLNTVNLFVNFNNLISQDNNDKKFTNLNLFDSHRYQISCFLCYNLKSMK